MLTNYFSKFSFYAAFHMTLLAAASVCGQTHSPTQPDRSTSTPQNHNQPKKRAFYNYQGGEAIAFRDRNEDKTLYERNARLGDWDYKENWRYDKSAFYSGETQPEAYREEHRGTGGGIGYDGDDEIRINENTIHYLNNPNQNDDRRRPNRDYYYDNDRNYYPNDFNNSYSHLAAVNHDQRGLVSANPVYGTNRAVNPSNSYHGGMHYSNNAPNVYLSNPNYANYSTETTYPSQTYNQNGSYSQSAVPSYSSTPSYTTTSSYPYSGSYYNTGSYSTTPGYPSYNSAQAFPAQTYNSTYNRSAYPVSTYNNNDAPYYPTYGR